MTIRFPSSKACKRAMTLVEMLVVLSCLITAISVSVYLGSSHHWIVAVIAFPVAFCSGMTVFGLLGEIAVRSGFSRMGRTPGTVICRSLVVGAIVGLTLGAAFYYLVDQGIIPTAAGGWHRAVISACAFGGSVALAVASFVMFRTDRQKSATSVA